MTGEQTIHIANTVEVPEGTASMIATGGHLAANFIPNPFVGGVVDFAFSTIDREANQHVFLKTWGAALAKKLRVKPQQLEGEQGIALVEAHLETLPPALQHEWNKISDLNSKTADFMANGIAQIGGGALIGTLLGSFLIPPLGMVVGFVGGAGAGYVASRMMKDVTGDTDGLLASEVLPAIQQVAVQAQHAQGKARAVVIDKSLVGAYLIASHSTEGGLFEEYNGEELKRMFAEHMAAKAEDPKARTELDEFIAELEHDGTFAVLLPETMDTKKIKSGGVLATIAANMQSQEDLENWLFAPEHVKQKLAAGARTHIHPELALEQARVAGKHLHQSIDVPMSTHSAPHPERGRDLTM